MLNIHITELQEQDPAIKAILKNAAEAGVSGGRKLTHICKVARDTDASLAGGFDYAGHRWTQFGKSQFGKNVRGQVYLTFVATNELDERQTFRWIGDFVQKALLRVAAYHDLGEAHEAIDVPLVFEDAVITPVITRLRDDKRRKSDLKYRRKQRDPNTDPRTYGRVCLADL